MNYITNKLYNPQYEFDFKKSKDFKKRRTEAKIIKKKYPNRIPVICEIHQDSRYKINLDKTKYLVPLDINMAHFLHVVRTRANLMAEDAIFTFINNQLPPISANMESLYEEHADEDGFLYIMITTESTFG
jgi:GABA(A) receptor-associated protein